MLNSRNNSAKLIEVSSRIKTDMSTKRVLLWTAPRCVSTAFERSIMTLRNSKILHEPYSTAYYFGPERQSTRYVATPVDEKATYRAVNMAIQKEYDGKELLFSKDMAYCVENKLHMFLEEGFKDIEHTFLIRDPVKAVYSLYKLATNPKLTGWDYFDPVEAGFQQMYELYEFLQKHMLRGSVVVDADDLLEFPNETMMSYCEAVGIQYEEKMTTWEPGPIPEWDVWVGWHDNALKSSGFHRKTSTSRQKEIDLAELPEEVLSTLEKSKNYYDKLYAARIRPKNVAMA